MIILILLAIIFTLSYVFHKWNYGYWKRRGVPGPKPVFIFGNILDGLLLKKSAAEIFTNIYKDFPGLPLVGIYRGLSPCVLVRDPELIMEITVKSFQHFHDNDHFADKEVDPLFGRNPLYMKGAEWKSTRSLLTPCFTTGKIKSIYPSIEENSKKLMHFITKQPDATSGRCLEAKELSTKFTLSNVGNCAFGVDAKCFDEPKSELRDLAHRFLAPSSWTSIKLALSFLIPSLPKYLKIKIVKKDVEDQLMDVVTQSLRHKRANNILTDDFVSFLAQREITDVDITAHAASFFVDGYETSATAMSFVLYALADNPQAQSIVRNEVRKGFDENNDTLPYEAVQSMAYLDAVINETMRIYPPWWVLLKLCTAPYTYTPKSNDGLKKSSVTIEKDTSIILPVHGLQNDPQYYAEPERFKPERFLGANREKLVKYTYFPFGEGPRACLGQRFGVMQIKAGVAYVVKNYELSVNTKTKQPLEYDSSYHMLATKGGLWINFKRITTA